jgi:hypothetical protein
VSSFRDHHAPILDAALDVLERELGKPARLRVRRVNDAGGHAFVYAHILDRDGRLIDYTGTPFAEAASNGGKSFTYAALLGVRGERWTVLEHAVGPTDLAWQGWADRHQVSPALFDVPTD